MTPEVSVLLLTRNAMAYLGALLDAIDVHRHAEVLEIVGVDSGSTDGTAAALYQRADKVVSIAPHTFNHGTSRNLGVAACHGDLVVLLAQDALPASPRWLSELLHPLRVDPQVAGSFARHVPRVEATPLACSIVARAGAAQMKRRERTTTPAHYAQLTPAERLRLCGFDNVCACIRRAVWEKIPFAPCALGEDVAWAKQVLLAGHKLVYVPEAVVAHSHDRCLTYEFARTYLLHQHLYELFGLRCVQDLPHLAVAIGATMVAHGRCILGAPALNRRTLTHLGRDLCLAALWPLAQYLGSRLHAQPRWISRWLESRQALG